ncbi:MAG: SHOCT domain-containing protein [Planctomycetes bacterium]|nr:SHOCT domain-containing protein [Planctomycetota bacterium]
MRSWLPAALLLALCAAALAQPGGDPARDVQQKLQALEKAYQAGILSQAEYAQKKAKLEEDLAAMQPALDEETVKKLKALDAALEAGVLSRAEFEQKKAELTGRKATPPTVANPLDVPAPTRTAGKLARYTDPDGRFQFHFPEGATVQTLPDGMGAAVAHGKAGASVLVWKNLKQGKQVVDAFSGQIRDQWKSFQEIRRGEGKIGGLPAVMIEFAGVNLEGAASHGLIAGVEAGGLALSVSRIGPDGDYAALEPVWEILLASFEAGAGTEDAGRPGQLYRHPIGFSFWQPAGWTVKEHDDFLQLEPPDAASNEQGPEELYFIIGDTVEGEGITSADHPQVAEYLDEFVKENLTPALQRSGGTKTMPISKGTGVIYDWRTKSPTTGKTVLARAYTVILRDHGVALLAFGIEDRVAARDAELRRIFASFGFGEGAKDPALVGTWELTSSQTVWNKGLARADERAKVGRQEKSTFQIRADGTWTHIYVWELLVMGAGHSLESGPQREVAEGRWSAGNGVFYRSFKDGTWCDEKYQLRRTQGGIELVLENEKTQRIFRRTGD